MSDYSGAPTDSQIIEAFEAFASERAEGGVLMAKAVARISFADGRVTVVVDPALSGAEYWALMETASHDNQAKLFGAPAAFNSDEGIWLRKQVEAVEVVDVDGRPLGALTAAELNKMATGD